MSETTLSSTEPEGRVCTTVTSIIATVTVTLAPSPTTSVSSSTGSTITTTQVSPLEPEVIASAIVSASARSISLRDTRFLILISVTGAIFLLVLVSLLIFLLYFRRKHNFKSQNTREINEDSPPLTSLDPPPISFATSQSASRIPPLDSSFVISPLSRGSNLGQTVQSSVPKTPTRPKRSVSTPFLVPEYETKNFPSRQEGDIAQVAPSPGAPPSHPIPATPRTPRIPRTPIIPEIDFQSTTPSSGESDVREIGYKIPERGSPVSPLTKQQSPSGATQNPRFEEESFVGSQIKEDDAASMSIFRPGEAVWFSSDLPPRVVEGAGGGERENTGSSKGKEVETVGSQSLDEEEEDDGRVETFDYFRFPVTGTRASSGVFPDPHGRKDVG